MTVKAIYPGTFDPVTNGHTDLIARASRVFNEVIVGVASSPSKKPRFDLTQRVKMIEEVTKHLSNVTVVGFTGLLVDFAKENKLDFTINGWGGGSAELASLSLKKNGIDLTVMRINDDNGVAMAEAIKYELEQKTPLIPRVFSGEMVIIDKETTKEEIEKLKKR